jgi:hypothetical protein
MFQDMLDAWEAGRQPMETFYDGYVVNAVVDACYRSMKSGRWEPIKIEDWPWEVEAPAVAGSMPRNGERKAGQARARVRAGGVSTGRGGAPPPEGPTKAPGRPQEAMKAPGDGVGRGQAGKAALIEIKTERLPDGRIKRILRDRKTGRIVEETG